MEGQIYNGSTKTGSATITREYQVIPKCCGASFGSNGSGGVDVTSPSATNPSLGSDSRYCGVDFGMLTGINGGKMWTYYSNDNYTQRINGQVVKLNSMLGLVDQAGDPFSRANATINGRNVGCRVIPGPCSTSSDVYVSGSSDQSLYGNIPASPNANFTSQTDIAGTSASGVPIIPLTLTGGLPTIASKYAYTWTSGGRPAARLAASPQQFPSFTSKSGTPSTVIVMRSRNDTTPPRLELCEATYPSTCSATSWASISTSGTLSIADDFSSGNYSGTTSGSVNRWPGSWTETDPGSSTAPLWTTGLVTINSGALRITGNGSATTQAITRSINLHALQSPYLKFTYTRSTSPTSLIVEYSADNGTNYTNIATIAATTTSGSSQTFALPAAAQTPYTILRFRPGAALANAEWIAIDDVSITNSTGTAVSYDNWCEYSSTFPNITPNPYYVGGFHCIGPTLAFQNGGTFRVDSSGGGISWYYNDSNDTRGAGTNIVGTTPVIYMASGASLSHVNCSGQIPPTSTITPSNTCTTLIGDTVYAPVGQFDMFNIFGRDSSPGGSGSKSMQWIQIGSFSGAVTGKIAGAWFYMPWGALYLIADQCGGSGGSTVDFTDPDAWNFGGRLWMRLVVPCGTNYFRVPPSSAAELSALIGANPLNSSTRSFVNWSGIDWIARSVVSSRTNWSL